MASRRLRPDHQQTGVNSCASHSSPNSGFAKHRRLQQRAETQSECTPHVRLTAGVHDANDTRREHVEECVTQHV